VPKELHNWVIYTDKSEDFYPHSKLHASLLNEIRKLLLQSNEDCCNFLIHLQKKYFI